MSRSLHIDRQHPLLATKLFVPQLRSQTIVRQRLLARLDSLLECRLALVCAPAGYGKTTLLSSWVAQLTGERVIWISLDKEDDEPLIFWRYLLSAMGISDQSIPLSQTDEDRVTRLMLTRLLNEATHYAGHVVVLLDDYHLIQNQAIHDKMLFLLEHLPPNMHLGLATRSEPPLPLARLRLRRQLVELRMEDLRFTHTEVAAFIQQEYNAELEEHDLAILEKLSEGWVAGLQLTALSLNGRSEVSAFIQRLSGNQRYIFDYLAEEVLASLSSEEQTFLLRTSILARLCSGVCNALTDNDNAQAMLTRLVQVNLFLIPLDDQGNWYRYHHLFAGAIYQRLQQLAPSSIPALHKQASAWYEQHGLIDEAFEHALTIPDFEQAARLLLSDGKRMLLHGEMRKLRAWIERLPNTVVRPNPSLSLAYFWALADAQRFPEMEQCLNDMRQALSENTTLMNAEFEVGLHSAGSTYERHRKNFAQAIILLHQALAVTSQADHRQRCYMLLHLAEYHWSIGELAQAQRAIQESLKASEAGGYDYFITTGWLYLARMQAMAGQLKHALATYQRGLFLANKHEGPALSLSSVAHLGLALLYYELNDLVSAQKHQRECERFSQQAGNSHTLFYSSVLLTQIRLTSGNLAGARAALPDFKLRPEDFDFFFPFDGFIELYTRVQIALGAYENATIVLNQLSESHLSPLLQGDLQLARTRLLLSQTQDKLEISGLQPLLQRAQMDGRKKSVLRILLVQTLASRKQDALTRASACLLRALALAETAGFLRIFADEGASLHSLLLSLRATPTTSQDYITQLLAAFPPETISDVFEQNAPATEIFSLRDPLSERELEILRLISAGHSNQEIASQLVIALSTLKTHINRMYAKLRVSSRTQALARARKLRLL